MVLSCRKIVTLATGISNTFMHRLLVFYKTVCLSCLILTLAAQIFNTFVFRLAMFLRLLFCVAWSPHWLQKYETLACLYVLCNAKPDFVLKLNSHISHLCWNCLSSSLFKVTSGILLFYFLKKLANNLAPNLTLAS